MTARGTVTTLDSGTWPPRQPILAREQPDHSRALARDIAGGFAVDQPCALFLLDAAGGAVGFGVAQPEMRPTEFDEGEFGDPFGGFGHQALPRGRRGDLAATDVGGHA